MPLSPTAKLVAVPIISAITAVALFAPRLAANLYEMAVCWPHQRVAPEVYRVVTIPALIGAIGSPLVLVVLLATMGRRALVGRRWWFKVLYVVGTLAAQWATLLALLLAMVLSGGFGNHFENCTTAPDGAHTACIYEDGGLCGHDVYVRPRGALVLTEVKLTAQECVDAAPGPQLQWVDNSHVELIDANGQLITPGVFSVVGP